MTKEDINRLMNMIGETKNFDKKQIMEAFYWMILGDGCLENSGGNSNYRISVSHKLEHEDYIAWKASIIERVTSCNVGYRSVKSNTLRFNRSGDAFPVGSHEMVRLRSSAHPWFTKVRDRIYGVLGRKSLDPYALSLLGPLGLAILYQDDGSLNVTHRTKSDRVNPWIERNLLIHKMCFSKYELEAFAKVVVDKFGIIFRINRVKNRGLGYRLRMRSKDIDKFFSLIEPYVVPSMSYKVVRGGASIEAITCSELHSDMQNSAEMTG